MSKLRVLDLFSGIGGFSLGLERTGGFETVAFCEIEPFPRKVLAKHWPGVPIFEDVRELRGHHVGPVDVVCGGFPCQPFSTAGKRRGIEDDRHLWPEMLRIIDECRPTWVIGENVGGLVSMVERRGPAKVESRSGGRHANGVDYESVLIRQETMLLDSIANDLGSIGYEVQPFVIPACAVGAPHRRDRCWIVAHRDTNGTSERRDGREVCDLDGNGQASEPERHELEPRIDGDGPLADPGIRRLGRPDSREAEQPRRAEAIGTGEDVADASRLQQGRQDERSERERVGAGGESVDVADADPAGFQERKRKNASGARAHGGAEFERVCSWLPEPDVGRVAHGVPQRVDRLKALGNAVVPKNVTMLGNAILATAPTA